MLELRNIDIGYSSKKERKIVFSGLSASFNKGEIIGLVGNNGVGKSTLLKTITGTLPVLEGDILVAGKSLKDYSIEELAKCIALVLTDRIGGFNLTVFDVVASGRIPFLNAFSQLRKEDEEIAIESLAKVGIEDLAGRLIDELSDGQRQKVMIAKSLAQQTPVILLDEPTAFLDFSSRQQLFSILKRLAQEEQKTIIISSHDLDILFKNSNRVLYLQAGNKYIMNEPDVVKKHFV